MKYRTFHDNEHLYFLTSTISGHFQLFTEEVYIKIVLNCLKYLREKSFINVFAFVMIPDHVHVLIKVLKEYTIHHITEKFHSFTAHRLLRQLRINNNTKVLEYFQNYAMARKKDRQHYIWENTLVKNIFSVDAMNKVIEYIHSNPCNKKWHLVENRADYKYSSACFYDMGIQPIIEIDDVRELFH